MTTGVRLIFYFYVSEECFCFFSYRCRAKIVELEPLTIYYIDFGNEEKVDIEDLYPLPKKFQTTPPMVMCF